MFRQVDFMWPPDHICSVPQAGSCLDQLPLVTPGFLFKSELLAKHYLESGYEVYAEKLITNGVTSEDENVRKVLESLWQRGDLNATCIICKALGNLAF
jgi:hypothetical protein